jgi:hypothetical protein
MTILTGRRETTDLSPWKLLTRVVLLNLPGGSLPSLVPSLVSCLIECSGDRNDCRAVERRVAPERIAVHPRID